MSHALPTSLQVLQQQAYLLFYIRIATGAASNWFDGNVWNGGDVGDPWVVVAHSG